MEQCPHCSDRLISDGYGELIHSKTWKYFCEFKTDEIRPTSGSNSSAARRFSRRAERRRDMERD